VSIRNVIFWHMTPCSLVDRSVHMLQMELLSPYWVEFPNLNVHRSRKIPCFSTCSFGRNDKVNLREVVCITMKSAINLALRHASALWQPHFTMAKCVWEERRTTWVSSKGLACIMLLGRMGLVGVPKLRSKLVPSCRKRAVQGDHLEVSRLPLNFTWLTRVWDLEIFSLAPEMK
jgi:hypothetical protein